jgi:hypothetical protein
MTVEQEAARRRNAARDAITRRLAAQVRADVAAGGRLIHEEVFAGGYVSALWADQRVTQKIDAEIARQWFDPDSDPPRIELLGYERRIITPRERRLAKEEGLVE